MASAFQSISQANAEFVRKRFLSGAGMKEIRQDLPGIDAATMRKLRDEMFIPLLTDPQAVKELANGPMLNPCGSVRMPAAQQVLRTLKQKAAAEALADNDREVIYERHHGLEKTTFGQLARAFGVHSNTIKAICKAKA